MESADDISCLHKQGVRRYANAYIDRQVRQPITALGTGHNLAVVELNNSSSEDLYLHTLQIIKTCPYHFLMQSGTHALSVYFRQQNLNYKILKPSQISSLPF